MHGRVLWMNFIGKMLYHSPKVLKKKPQKIGYYRVTIVNPEGSIETIALTSLEYKKAKKRARQGILFVKPTFLMLLYGMVIKLLGKKQKISTRR
jgi:hypothetical protein